VQEALSPRLGCVQYLNARPLARGWPGEVQFDHPSALCRRLAAGQLDVALVSSFEFLRNPIYSIVDGVAIASDGPVHSVFVAHHPDTSYSEMELDLASTTAVSLLRCLLRERRQQNWTEAPPPPDILSPLASGRARLLIGDQAIRFRDKFQHAYSYWDLGETWRELTQLPFVYALWLIRPEVARAGEIAHELRRLRDRNLAHIDELIEAETEFDPGFCAYYYGECLRYDFGEREKAGLRSFEDLCVEHGLLKERAARMRLL
jgi:chorismate dehydratase